MSAEIKSIKCFDQIVTKSRFGKKVLSETIAVALRLSSHVITTTLTYLHLMQIKNDISSTAIFYLAILSSMLLFLSIWFAQKMVSEIWILYIFIFLPVILFFAVTSVAALIFWLRNRSKFDMPYLPLAINSLFLGLIIILPLNKIRNRIKFETHQSQYEKAVDFVLSKQTEQTTYPEIVKLPENYQYLSVGGGEVLVINKDNKKGVFFYSFRGTPEGQIGFLRIKGNDNINDFNKELFNEVDEVKKIDDNWYYISAE